LGKTIDTTLRLLIGADPDHYFHDRITTHPGPWGERILSELVYANELSKVNGGKYDDIVGAALGFLEERLSAERMISRETAFETESLLSGLAAEAKSYDVICPAHAHIDMNWMWPWQETVSITIDTFRTILNLMDEYPELKFSQSQAAIYRIVEQYAPDMLAEIKRKVQEGRWEVTASHWVEADKNMPSGESLTRHLLYSKRYLSQLLDLDPATLDLDFEPDTFGHSANVPEILTTGGVRYYYHCRGYDGHILYRWEALSGKSVIVYREPTWYNDVVQPIVGAYVPEICRQTGLKTFLNVFGMGDHGGGPSRRDLERLIGMNDWPIYPNFRFGTLGEFFRIAETVSEQLPVVKGELNFVFTGCYTSQTRIKTANRAGEAVLREAELFGSVAAVAAGAAYSRESFENAWRNVLFNQFHDILPGSGVLETREHALGLFQETMAIAGTGRKLALERIAATIDTSGLAVNEGKLTVSEGAGVGYGIDRFKVSQVERGHGPRRIVHVFNPSLSDRKEVVEVVLWDWQTPIRALTVRDADGNPAAWQYLDHGHHPYWGHDYMRLLIQAGVPACGYATYTIEAGEDEYRPYFPPDPRLDQPETYVLENDLISAELHPVYGTVVSLIDKKTGEALVRPDRPAGEFRLVQEDPSLGMTSWRVGRYMHVRSLHEHVKFVKRETGELRSSLAYEIAFGRSRLTVTIALHKGSPALEFEAECDWHEIGNMTVGIPQLQFYWPHAYACEKYKYDAPMGTIARPPLAMDVPGNSWAIASRQETAKPSVMIVTSNKYGFRGDGQSLSVSLIRGSFNPDPYPETGDHHRIRLAVRVAAEPDNGGLIEAASRFNHPLSVLSGTPHQGARPLAAGFAKLLEGTAALSAIKMPEQAEDGKWIVRLYETEGEPTVARLQVFQPVQEAYFVDASEIRLADGPDVAIDGETVAFPVGAYAIASVCLVF